MTYKELCEQLKDGQAVYMKTFQGSYERAILDESVIITKDAANHADYHRYAFDWHKMKKYLSTDAVGFYTAFEKGINGKTGFIGNRNGGRGFIGWTRLDVNNQRQIFAGSPEDVYNRWIDSETVLVNKKRFCKVKLMDIVTIIPSQPPYSKTVNVTYRRLDVKK